MIHPDRFLLAGVMGSPVMHSRSPMLHNYWLKRHGLAGAYLPLAVKAEGLRAALRALPALGFAGCNLTIPHKEAALAIVDKVDAVARRIGGSTASWSRPTARSKARTTTPSAMSRACARRSRHGAPTPGRSSCLAPAAERGRCW